MQAYDLIMLIVLAMTTIFGAIKGFAWQVASLASLVVSYIVAYRFRFEVAEMIQAKPPWNQFLAMLLLYVGTSFVIWVGFRLFSSLIDGVRLKEFDRHLGAGFGLAKGSIFCLLITMFAMSLLGPNQQAAICQSRSGYYIAKALDHGMGILPQELHDVVGPYLARLDERLKHGASVPATREDASDESAWPFDSANLNQQLNQLQVPNGLSELVPVPSNLVSPGGNTTLPNGGLQQLPNGSQQAPGLMPPRGQAGGQVPGGFNGGGQYDGRQYYGGPTSGNPTSGNQSSQGTGFGGAGYGDNSFGGNALGGSAAYSPASQIQNSSGIGFQAGGSTLPPGQTGSPYPSGASQQAQQPRYVLPR